MAAGNAFLTQLSERVWKCSECALVFLSNESRDVDGMLEQFASHAKRQHREPSFTRQTRTQTADAMGKRFLRSGAGQPRAPRM